MIFLRDKRVYKVDTINSSFFILGIMIKLTEHFSSIIFRRRLPTAIDRQPS